MGGGGRRLVLLAAALALGAPAAGAPAPSSLDALEGRAPAAPGALARELGAGRAVVRFAAPAGGHAELVVYLAAQPRPRALVLSERVALSSLLGVPGEILLEGRLPGAEALAPRPAETEAQAVPEPGTAALLLLGLAVVGWGCHPACPWSGPPRD